MNRVESERPSRWLMILRVAIVTTLLISAFTIELLLRPGPTLRPLFMLAAVAYGMVLAYAALDRWLAGTAAFTYLQLVGDAAVVTAFVGITGGLESPMSFLYLLPICVACLVRYRTGGIALATVSWLMYASLVLVGDRFAPFGRLVEAPAEREPWRISYSLLVHAVGFVAVAMLASYLSERVRVQGRELVERTGAVARLQALNENIIESIHSGLVTTDLSGRIHFMNRGGAEITGVPVQSMLGRSVEDAFGLERGFLKDARARLTTSRRFRFEENFRRPDDRRIYLGFAVSVLHDRRGAPLGYILIFQDLTEIQALEQEVRLKERMAALGEMAAGMAHELRNPLAAISGSVQYLRSDLAPEGETRDLMDIILRESQRLDQAIRDFLTFARPGTFAPQRCDLARLIDDSVKLLRKSREFLRGHEVAMRYDALEIPCDIDPNRMKQVFWNLAINALKAMPLGGTLSIDVRLPKPGVAIEITFSDEGIGMDAEALAGYFQPFRSAFQGGTGLGAAIVYRLVEEHGGRIAVESSPGKGTRVSIGLPRYLRREASPEPAVQQVAVGGGARS